MIINSTGERVEEHIYANERKGELIYRSVDPQTKVETENDSAMPVLEAPSLIWECVRQHNSFIRKAQGQHMRLLSAEKGNLCGLHSFKYSVSMVNYSPRK